eukprot:2756500-Rhodomonas_salina.2
MHSGSGGSREMLDGVGGGEALALRQRGEGSAGHAVLASGPGIWRGTWSQTPGSDVVLQGGVGLAQSRRVWRDLDRQLELCGVLRRDDLLPECRKSMISHRHVSFQSVWHRAGFTP